MAAFAFVAVSVQKIDSGLTDVEGSRSLYHYRDRDMYFIFLGTVAHRLNYIQALKSKFRKSLLN